MPWIACSDPGLPRYCTPGNLTDDLCAFGLAKASRGHPDGWRTLWAALDAVRVDNPGASRREHAILAARLAGLGWETEIQPDGWIKVTGMRTSAAAGDPGRRLEVTRHVRAALGTPARRWGDLIGRAVASGAAEDPPVTAAEVTAELGRLLARVVQDGGTL
jgi:hypothetical protein